MAHLAVNDQELDRRLRAARPAAADVDPHAVDPLLLERLRGEPVAPRNRGRVPRAMAVPAAVGATTLAVAAGVALVGGPGDVGGPSSAAAITQALHWLSPPPGTVLHTRAVETQGGQTQVVEFWQAADHPNDARMSVSGSGPAYESEGDQLYETATDTIYDLPNGPGDGGGKGKVALGNPAGGPQELPLGDPMVTKVRTLLQRGDMVVSGPEDHGGIQAYVIALKPDVGRPVWRLWVSAADGRPLELSDPGRDANEAPQEIRWPVYEVVPAGDASSSLSLRAAHPDARVVDDADAAGAAMQRIFGDAKAAAADHGRKPS